MYTYTPSRSRNELNYSDAAEEGGAVSSSMKGGHTCVITLNVHKVVTDVPWAGGMKTMIIRQVGERAASYMR